jgi:hypothetical protein
MAVQQHAITPAARRAGFWPSVAVASARLPHERLLRIGRGQPGDPAVLRLASPGSIGRRDAGGVR